MKKNFFTLLIIVLAISGLHAQDLQIHKTDGTIVTVPLNAIDSITFANGGTGGQGQPCPGTPTVTDIDGNAYNTVLIGNQCWMKENLKTTKYRNNTPIEYPGSNNSAWENNTTGVYAWYENDISWKDSYGALYNWYAVNNSNGLCPVGWHVPSDAEWNVLILHIDPNADPNAWGIQSYIAGGKMKSTRTVPDSHPRWETPNTGATDESDWSGHPGGSRITIGPFFHAMGIFGVWWSSIDDSSASAWYRSMNYYDGYIHRDVHIKKTGISVRCLRD